MHITLTPQDYEDILNTSLVPVKHPEVGQKYFYKAKVGGVRKIVDVQVKRPYRAPYGNGRTTLYADVFGYGFRGAVQARKLLKQDKVTA
jgi:hypothetical protein